MRHNLCLVASLFLGIYAQFLSILNSINIEQVKNVLGSVLWASHTRQNKTKMQQLAEGTKTSIFNTCCLLFICTLGMEIWAEMKVPGTTHLPFLVSHSWMLSSSFVFLFSLVPGNLGCYKDHGNPPPLTGTSKTSNKLTIQNCISFCRSQRFKVIVLSFIPMEKDKGLNAFC